MEKKNRALLVGAEDRTEKRMQVVLEDWGWETTACPGPSASTCPLLVGAPCPVREEADAAVVFVDAHSGSSGVLPKLRCAGDHSSPYVLALEGSLLKAEEHTGGTVIGSRRGEEAIAYAVVRNGTE